jgi:hypothetical protein
MTILFAEDWSKYPNSIADYKTTNRSFVRLAALYRDMSIANHSFLLALHNPALQGVDPHSPDLTLDQIALITIECKENFWYYVREVVRIPGLAGGDPIPFRASRGNIALYWLFFNHIFTLLIQIRQTGKSVGMDTLNRYLTNVRCRNTDIYLITKDDDLRSKNLARMKEMESCLPFYFRLRQKNDLANNEEYTIKMLKNTYKGLLAQSSPKAALNLGRGLTTPIVQFDEAAFLYNIRISLPAALAAGIAARDSARANNEPYGTVLTTTAGKKDDRDGSYVYSLLMQASIWSEGFLDAKNLEDLEDIIRKASGGELMVNCTFSHRQLGYDDEWLKKVLDETKARGEDADRDLFNIWTSGSQSSPLDVRLMEAIKNSKRDDYYTEICAPYNYIIRWFVPENQIVHRMNSSFFAMAIDSSDAIGKDDIAMNLRDVKTGEIIAAGNYNETNILLFCQWLVTLFVKYPNFVLIIERRSTGSSIIDTLIMMLLAKNIDPFKRIWNKVVHESDEYKDRFKEINRDLFARDPEVYTRYKKLFGFATSSGGMTSRAELYSTTLLNAAKQTGHAVHDPKTVSQILTLEVRNGRVDHQQGSHDDNVIAWLLSYWIISQGKNLGFYGINPRDILSNVIKHEPETPLENYNQAEQKYLRYLIEETVERIKEERDDFITQKLEAKLRMLAAKLIIEENEHFSVDSLLHDLQEQKRISRSTNNMFNRQNYTMSPYGQMKYR